MDYFRTLNLEKEPFSNSPDPGLFFNSRQHREALQQLEISIRLRRGLNVVTGDVGTGKTTVCRQLIRKISSDEKIRYYLILDPGFASAAEFLCAVLAQFTGIIPPKEEAENEILLKEKIKSFLFSVGVDQDMTTVLLIDEGQKLPPFCLETLRELLNYETNATKLLQIVIFAQKEFNPMIAGMENFVDRINFRYTFSPLDFKETRGLIRYRIEQSSCGAYTGKRLPEFSYPAFWAVYRLTQGYPRKIINLCHHVLLALIIKEKSNAGYFFVKSCARQVLSPENVKPGFSFAAVAMPVIILLTAAGLMNLDKMTNLIPERIKTGIIAARVSLPEPAPETAVAAVSMPVPEKAVPPEPVAVPETPPDETPAPKPVPVVLPAEVPARTILLPDILGSIRIPKDETLYNMLETVYGRYTRPYVARFMEENKNIENPNRIRHGILVDFPVIADSRARWKETRACLIAARENSFEAAYEKARACRSKGLDARVISAWGPDDGFMYAVVLDRVFNTAEEACRRKSGLNKKLPLEESTIAALVQGRTIL